MGPAIWTGITERRDSESSASEIKWKTQFNQKRLPSCYSQNISKNERYCLSQSFHLHKLELGWPVSYYSLIHIGSKSPCSSIRTSISIRNQTPVSRRGTRSRSAGQPWTNLASRVAWACIIIRFSRGQTPAPWCQPLCIGHVATTLWTKPRPKLLAHGRPLSRRTLTSWSAMATTPSMTMITNWTAWNTPASTPAVYVSVHETVEEWGWSQF